MKKMLIGMLAVFILGSLLFILTGCGKSQETGGVNSNNVSLKNTVTVKDITENAENYYGKVITNYNPIEEMDPDLKWKIFLADTEDDRIYLIASDYVSINYLPKGLFTSHSDNDYYICESTDGSAVAYQDPSFDNLFDDYTISKWHKWMNKEYNKYVLHDGFIGELLNKEKWSMFKDNQFSDYAIGAPSLEMFLQSFNDTISNDKLEFDFELTNNSYYKIDMDFAEKYLIKYGKMDNAQILTDLLDLYNTSYGSNKPSTLWLSSPGGDPNKGFGVIRYSVPKFSYTDPENPGGNNGIRPVIALEKGLTLKKVNGGYELVK